MPEENKPNFLKIAVKPEVKREIDILAATEQRHVYEIVDDMLKLYQASKTNSPVLEKKRISAAERPEPVAA